MMHVSSLIRRPLKAVASKERFCLILAMRPDVFELHPIEPIYLKDALSFGIIAHF